jgi:hypothetical protein
MPTGQKTIVWTAANDERLLLSILAVHSIKVDAPSVAKVFGKITFTISSFTACRK